MSVIKRKVVYKMPLVRELAEKTQIPEVQASFIYDVLMDLMLKKLKSGTDVLLPNIGRIGLVHRKEQTSNLTGQHVPPHKRLIFSVNVKLARFIRINTREYPIK
jgi:nucleoid DNA-binding protein